jgi:hypothetical protein
MATSLREHIHSHSKGSCYSPAVCHCKSIEKCYKLKDNWQALILVITESTQKGGGVLGTRV